MDPTPEQQSVIDHDPRNNGRVLAGPGTGKSVTVALLAARLETLNPRPLTRFITFTRAATAELAAKLERHATLTKRPSTMHSFSISVLLENPGAAVFPLPLRIPTEYEVETVIHPHLAQLNSVTLAEIRKLESEMAAQWQSLNPLELPEISLQTRARFLGIFRQHRNIFGYTLLSELPELFRQALAAHDDLTGLDYQLLIVDEFQDLNRCEHEVLKRLSDRGISILAIGDDDQSIYFKRKAHPIGIQRFLDDYPGSQDYPLTICHRLHQNMLNWAQHVIDGEPSRAPKQPPVAGNNIDGTSTLLSFRSEVAEAVGVAQLIRWLHADKQIPLHEILVLTRSDWNAYFSRRVKTELEARGLEFFDASEAKRRLNTPEFQKLLSLLRLLNDNADSLAWRCLMHLTRGIGSACVDHIYAQAAQLNTTFGAALNDEASNRFSRIPSKSVGSRTAAFFESITNVLNDLSLPSAEEKPLWGEWIVEQVQAGRLPTVDAEVLALVRAVGERIDTTKNESLGYFLSQLYPLAADLAQEQKEGVRFMTFAGSKGLTAEAVIVLGVDNDLIPKPNNDQAEERRLLYVAMTRAKEYLFLTWATRRRGPQARSGTTNVGARRQYSSFLQGGPIETRDGEGFIATLS